MIWESCYWKDPLLEMAARLAELIAKEEWTDEEAAQFERDVFIGFYSVRKLFEAPAKVSDETRATKLKVAWFAKRPGQALVDWYNRDEICELYDLRKAQGELRDAVFVTHRLIHSFIFRPSVAHGDHPDGVFFTSDTDKERRLYFIEVAEIVRLFREVGSDYPDIEVHRDRVSGEMKVRAFKALDG
jgi:hypothetical protein